MSFLPSSTPNIDRYYKYVEPSQLDKLRAMLNRDNIHLFHNMHLKIACMQALGVLMLIYVGAVLGEFWDSMYFQWGPPVMTRDVNIDVPWKYWLIMSVIAWDRIFAKASSYVIGNWRVNVILNPMRPPPRSEYYAKTMFILMTDHIVNMLRYAIMLVFVYAQIDFALAFAIPDILIDTFSAFWAASRLTERYRAEDAALCNRQDPTPVNPDKKLPKNVSGWNISPFTLTWFQWVEVLLFVLVFLFTGYFDTPYFEMGAPFPLFGKIYKNNMKYIFFIFFVFIDQILYSLHTAIVGPYVLSVLLNNSNPEIYYTKTGARFIYIAKKVFAVVRIIFLLFFIMSEFSFLLAMIIADLLVTYFMLNRILSKRYLKKNSGQKLGWMASIPLSEMWITIAVLIEMVIVIIVALAQLRIYRLPYFAWPPPLLLFDTIVMNKVAVALIIMYAVLDRVIFAFTTEITYPYIANVITGCDPDGLRYEFVDFIFIVFVDSSTNWLRRIVGFNFLLSNFTLVITQGAADVGASAIILEHYLKFKDNVRSAQAILQNALETSPLPPPTETTAPTLPKKQEPLVPPDVQKIQEEEMFTGTRYDRKKARKGKVLDTDRMHASSESYFQVTEKFE